MILGGILLLGLAACGGSHTDGPVEMAPTATGPGESPATASPASGGGGLLQPSDLAYLGAFRLPDGPPEIGWEYSGAALAYCPDGDPGGPEDGFPGSLFGTGHDWNQWVSEIAIPAPVNSAGRDLDELNTAATLQEFRDIRGGLFPAFEIPRAGLAILPPQGGQASPKLYFSWAQHMGEGDASPSHGWSELDLSNPRPAGPWRIADYPTYVTADYLFPIPTEWAEIHTPGMLLATGRYRDGGQGAQGPSLLAIGPWNEGNPPPPGSALPAVPLLLYGSVDTVGSPTLRDYHHADEWSGGAWLTAGDRAAVVLAGAKGQGECWPGCSDGTVWPDEPPYPEACDDFLRGWWSTRFEAQLIFYDPNELAAVARGELEPWEPQPYATLTLEPVLYAAGSDQRKQRVGDLSFDRERGLLYLMEPLADRNKPLVHVWRVSAARRGGPWLRSPKGLQSPPITAARTRVGALAAGAPRL